MKMQNHFAFRAYKLLNFLIPIYKHLCCRYGLFGVDCLCLIIYIVLLNQQAHLLQKQIAAQPARAIAYHNPAN